MAYMTIIRFQGDPDALYAYKREVMDPVMTRVAPDHGLISHAYARTDGGAIAVNVWQSREGSEGVAAEPDVAAAREKLQGIAAGPPSFEHFDLDDLRIASAATA